MPHISVMIPAFNRESLLPQSVQSILGQTFGDFDLVIVDDASTDDTVQAARKYSEADERVSLTVNSENLGLTKNWNRCLELARGPLVQIMQSDDLIDSDYLALVSEKFEEYPTLGFVAASCRSINAEGNVTDQGTPRREQLYRAGDEAVARILKGHPHVSSIVVRTECFRQLGGLDNTIWLAPDLEMDTRLAANYDFYDFGAVHTSFRRHGTNSGVLEFLRWDYVETFIDLLLRAWGFLSPDGVKAAGVEDVKKHVLAQTADLVLGGAAWMLAFGRVPFARHYLNVVRRLDPLTSRTPRYLRIRLLALLGPAGCAIARRRLGVTLRDLSGFIEAEANLRRKGLLLKPGGRRCGE